MDAHAKHDEVCFSEWLAYMGTHEANSAIVKGYWQRIERALSLLAAVEDGDELVRELRFFDREALGAGAASSICGKAAARITQDAQEKAALKAELASVKAHAEAMAAATDILRASFCTLGVSDLFKAQAAYRAARPKE